MGTLYHPCVDFRKKNPKIMMVHPPKTFLPPLLSLYHVVHLPLWIVMGRAGLGIFVYILCPDSTSVGILKTQERFPPPYLPLQ